MTSLAAVVLAHADAQHARRLLTALEDVPVVLHCDAKAPDSVAGEMTRGMGSRVRALPRTSGAMDSWSLVRIELDALRAALKHSSAEHIAVLSGADYPLVSMQELHDSLVPWAGRSYLASSPVPYAGWSTPRHPDGGLWRSAHHFVTRGDDLVFVHKFPVRLPWRRELPAGLQLRASSQWKVYSRDDVVRLLAAIDRRPDLVRFWRSTLVPDESFASSMLASPEIVGGDPLPDYRWNPWYLVWSDDGHHPRTLTGEDFEAVAQAARRPAGTPAALLAADAPPPRALFVRKVSTAVSTELLDRLDAEVRGCAPARAGTP